MKKGGYNTPRNKGKSTARSQVGNKMTEEGQVRQTMASPVENWGAQVHLRGAVTTQLQQPRVTCGETGQVLPDPTIFQENLEICISPNFSMMDTNLTEIQMCKPKKNIPGLDGDQGLLAGTLCAITEIREQRLWNGKSWVWIWPLQLPNLGKFLNFSQLYCFYLKIC